MILLSPMQNSFKEYSVRTNGQSKNMCRDHAVQTIEGATGDPHARFLLSTLQEQTHNGLSWAYDLDVETGCDLCSQ